MCSAFAYTYTCCAARSHFITHVIFIISIYFNGNDANTNFQFKLKDTNFSRHFLVLLLWIEIVYCWENARITCI